MDGSHVLKITRQEKLLICLFVYQVELAYQAPLNYRSEVTPYVFLLYSHQSTFSVSDEWRQRYTNGSTFNITQFAMDNNLEGI